MSETSIGKTEWAIGELATEFNVTLRTLRFYEEKGILAPRRADNGRDRIYDARDRDNLIAVLKARALGFTLEEAADLTHDRGELRLSNEQIVRQLHHLKAMVTQSKSAFLELWERLDKTSGSPVPGEDVLEVRAA